MQMIFYYQNVFLKFLDFRRQRQNRKALFLPRGFFRIVYPGGLGELQFNFRKP